MQTHLKASHPDRSQPTGLMAVIPMFVDASPILLVSDAVLLVSDAVFGGELLVSDAVLGGEAFGGDRPVLGQESLLLS